MHRLHKNCVILYKGLQHPSSIFTFIGDPGTNALRILRLKYLICNISARITFQELKWATLSFNVSASGNSGAEHISRSNYVNSSNPIPWPGQQSHCLSEYLRQMMPRGSHMFCCFWKNGSLIIWRPSDGVYIYLWGTWVIKYMMLKYKQLVSILRDYLH